MQLGHCFCVRIRQESLHLMSLDTGPKSFHVLSLKLSQVSYPKTNNWGKQPLLIYFLSLWEQAQHSCLSLNNQLFVCKVIIILCVKSMTLPRYCFRFSEPSWFIRYWGIITGVNLYLLKTQGHFENGKTQANIFQIHTQLFSLLIKFQLVKSIGLP